MIFGRDDGLVVAYRDPLQPARPLRAAVPNVLTVTGYALGLWWAAARGPTWAGLASIALDEIDGRVARRLDATSEMGSALDNMVDVALVPLSLMRLGSATGVGLPILLGAPPIIINQASSRAAGWRPPIGSWRAAIMIASMIAEAGAKKSRNKKARRR